MNYQHIVKGKFLSRPNRFIALVELDGRVEKCHVKNTGRCKELLLEGATVLLERAEEKGARKTLYDLVAVYKGDMLVNIDSSAPNAVAKSDLSRFYGADAV
ncbi:MAG: DNA/RNA nuclease SfsA, partial [Clostridia bacterium]|nr:DNA/RNA nuclease SfsA [Clostridia bacterium]